MKAPVYFLMTIILFAVISCKNENNQQTKPVKVDFSISDDNILEAIRKVKEEHTDEQSFRIERGVRQVASLWRESDGNIDEFMKFCVDNFISDDEKLYTAFKKLEHNFEILNGTFNNMSVKLLEPLHLDMGDIHFIDNIMGAYTPASHIDEDLFRNKMAFYIMLNFPSYSLKEKSENAEHWSRKDWAYARIGDLFISRIPAEFLQLASVAATDADTYIANYNIYMGNLVDEDMKTYFPEDMVLISHWGLRDELKTNYNKEDGLVKQKMIYDVMLRIVSQGIPETVINSNEYQWDPKNNKLYKDGEETEFNSEPYTRYEHLLRNFKSLSAMDKYNPIYPTYIERAYDESMELTQEEIEKLFIDFITSPEIKGVANLISKRLGRNLEPFDIWYDGFKARTNVDEDELSKVTRRKYPTAKAFKNDIPRILMDLGWSREKANYIADKISVDPSRGAGHAWGAEMKGDVAHLRTRVGKDGMDYKGYNIAIHELGHNVEQTITLYDIDYYMLRGVPNTGFTEAVAFLFQANDLKLLGQNSPSDHSKTEALSALDNCWSSFEIMGVSLVDMYVWQWMYENPDANPKELKDAVEKIAIKVWNDYYAPVFGVKDSPILGIYSHMIASPLYLANYPVGHLIEFQAEQYVKNKNFSDEITRMLLQGRVIPQVWMKGAVGSEISGQPTLNAVKKALNVIN
ncbi:MAG: hypothetical protein LBQ22_06520 [Bacteroidales bacterium]|jgi:hypothetical protein|nr:hypothetical protein [Bacteroidales bacterium]